MATIERTAYPRFPKVVATRDLQTCYTPQPGELEWARRSTRGERPRLGLLVLLKVFQQMHHFPSLDSIPTSVVEHVWPLLTELAWLSPGRFAGLSQRLADLSLDALRRKFDANFEGSGQTADLAWFPA
jgi:hypothetical protein